MKFFSELKTGGLLVATIIFLLPLPLAAQQSASQGTNAPPAKPGYGFSQAPCWKQAGIPQNVVEQHRSIEQNVHSRVQAVCSDASDAQEREKIRDIRKAGHEQMEELLTADQRNKLESCRAARGGAHRGRGPCAEFAAGKPAEAAPPK